MSDDLSNILDNTTKKNIKINNKQSNVIQEMTNYSKNKYDDFRETVSQLTNMQIIILLVIFVMLLIMIYLYYRYYKEQQKIYRFNNEPLFMTGIEENKPHNCKKIYRYIDQTNGKVTSYIPGYLFDEKNGNQYTFNFWMFINGRGWNYRFGEWKHIFHRGSTPSMPIDDEHSTNDKIVSLNTQLPGFWLSPKENRLNCVLTTGKNGEERITIDDIEINKWINITMVLNRNNVALYRNGLLEKSINLFEKIGNTKDAVYVNYFGGFAGNMAYLQYFNRALTPEEVKKLYEGFRENIDKYINHMFHKEIDRIKMCRPSDTKNQCNYLEWEKKIRQKKNYVNQIEESYKILCDNTSNMSQKECQIEQIKLNKYLKDITSDMLMGVKKKLIKNIKDIGQGYQYESIDNKKRIAVLNKIEIDKLRQLLKINY